MFEYTNPGFILMAGLLTFFALFITIYNSGEAQHNGTTMKVPYSVIISAAISIAIVVWDANDTYKIIEQNKRAFKSNQELVCSSLTTSYLVSRSKGWRLRGDKLTDGHILLDLQFCKK